MGTAPSSDPATQVSLAHIEAAEAILKQAISPSPLVPSSTLSRLTGGEVWLKAESLQRTGSFKIRGAYHKLWRMPASERARGVIAASAGNHAQGVALAATLLGTRSVIIMPKGTPLQKQLRTAGFGAEVRIHGRDYDEAYAHAIKVAEAEGLVYVHAFNDLDIIAGQGTVGLEILNDLPDVDAIVCPIGGGGLIAGIGAVLRERRPQTVLYGVQAEGSASAKAALAAGHPVTLTEATTLAEGIKVRTTGALPFGILRDTVAEVLTVAEEETTDAISWLLSDAKLVVEGAGAVGVAALMANKADLKGKQVCVVLSGGNIDLGLVSRVVEHTLTKAGRHTWLELMVHDRPGVLSQVVEVIAQEEVNILEVEHHRAGWRVPVGNVALSFLLETRDLQQRRRLADRLTERGWTVMGSDG